MGSRIFLFLATNLAIIVMLSIIMSVLGIGDYMGPAGLDYTALIVLCFLWGMGGSFLSLQMSRWLGKRATGAQLIDGRTDHRDLDWLHATVAKFAGQANLPMPEVAFYDAPEVNAFATGASRKRSLVAVSTGLLRSMPPDEVEGVLAHEVSHIANGDMVTMTLLQGVINAFVLFFARVIAFAVRQAVGARGSYMLSFGVMIVMQVVLGVLGAMITASFSRQREFRADRGGAILAGRERMTAALRRLATSSEPVDAQQLALASFKINGSRGWMALFSTHPPLEQRIGALESAIL